VILAKFDEATYSSFKATPMNFSVSVTPSSVEAKPGGNVTVTVTVALESGTPQTVTLQLLPPPGMAIGVTFQPPQGNPTFTSKMTIHVPETIPKGKFGIVVMAKSRDLTKTTIFTLKISNM